MGARPRILDVGSGGRPHKDATVLCDAYEHNEEGGGELTRDGRPFCWVEMNQLPFKESSFAYLYATHVLEHTTEPERLLKELTRVAVAGYIETPSPLAEKLYGWSYHKCTVAFKRGVFVFGPKIAPQGSIDLHRVYATFLPWKAFHKFLDLGLNLLYVRVVFSRRADEITYRKLGRAQAVRDLVRSRLREGVGPRPDVLQG